MNNAIAAPWGAATDQVEGGGSTPTLSLHTVSPEWRAASIVRPAERLQLEPMIQAHYLRSWPAVCVLRLGLFVHGEVVGCVVFALPPRETAKRYGGVTWELARLWVADSVPRNGESFLLGQAVRYIHKHHPDIQTLVSYADPSVGHKGTVYRAANWTPDGRTDEGRKTPRADYVCVATGKKYSRRKHVPAGTVVVRKARTAKPRFIWNFKR